MGVFALRETGLGGPAPVDEVPFYASNQKFKGTGNPNGRVPGRIGDEFIDTDDGTEWQKVADDLMKTGWIVEAQSEGILSFGADPTGVDDSADAFVEAFTAIPTGGILNLGDGNTYLVSDFALMRSDIKIYGKSTIKCSADVTQWLRITGSNVQIEGPTFDGDNKAMQGLQAGEYSTDWNIRNVRFKNFRVTNSNDPTNTASTGAATSVGFRMTKGNKRFIIENCYFNDIAYDGIKHSEIHGTGRAARGILGAPFPSVTTEAEAITDVFIRNCFFINSEADKALVDADAICFQNVLASSVLNCRIYVTDCTCDYWGWRFFKGQISGVYIVGNQITSRTTVAYGSADVDGYKKSMAGAIHCFGSNNIVLRNTIRGGSCGLPISIWSSDFHGRCENSVVVGNLIATEPALNLLGYQINLESVYKCTVSDNISNCGSRGIMVRGLCEFVSGGNNVTGATGFAGVDFLKDITTTTLYGGSPKNCSINGHIAVNSTSYGVNVTAECENITVYGVQGVAGVALVNYVTGATGERGLNRGSVSPLIAPTTNANHYVKIEAFADNTLSAKMTLAFENIVWSYASGTDTFTIGRANNVLSGAWAMSQAIDASAKLAINSVTSGFLPPRMTKAQRDAIASPTNGLMIYQSDATPGLREYRGGAWGILGWTADP